jgi:hypothetical protein
MLGRIASWRPAELFSGAFRETPRQPSHARERSRRTAARLIWDRTCDGKNPNLLVIEDNSFNLFCALHRAKH